LKGNIRRAIDFREGEKINEAAAFEQLVRAAVAANYGRGLNRQPGNFTHPHYCAAEPETRRDE
jgi:hypothetical protein